MDDRSNGVVILVRALLIRFTCKPDRLYFSTLYDTGCKKSMFKKYISGGVTRNTKQLSIWKPNQTYVTSSMNNNH